MDLTELFRVHWKKNFFQLSPANCRLLVAVSGGIDSVVLTDLMARSGFDITIAHVNFQLRGEESDRDEHFVRELASRYHAPIVIKKFDTPAYAAAYRIAIQEAARRLRYEWFEEIINRGDDKEDNRSAWILTAHHADDNIETAMMHFFRGTGLQGLTGIQPVQKERRLIRPLLVFRKESLKLHAAVNGLSFVEDSSNASDAYTRNFFRNTLLPQVKETFPRADENILHTIARLGEANDLYNQAISSHLAKLVERQGEEVHIPILKWKQAAPLHTITWELISQYGFHAPQVGEAIKLLDAENGSHISSPTHRIIKNRKWIIITTLATETSDHIIINDTDKEIIFPQGKLVIDKAQKSETRNPKSETASLDSRHIKFPLLLRRYRQGDYFYPLGMQKKKKVSRFLIDLKLSVTEKEKVWVLESDKRIIWVIGYRIDNRFRITEHTADFISLNYRK